MKWSELTPEQRDALVAEKVMGWKQAMPYEVYRCYLWKREDAPGLTKATPPFSTSLDATWEVLRYMVEHYCVDHPKQSEVWDRFCEASWEKYMESGNIYRWVATWTPEMLCRAALIGVGVEIEE